MYTTTTLPDKTSGFPWRRLGSDYRYACILNLVCGMLTTALLSSGHFFLENMAASMLIGTIVFLLIDVPRLAIWGADTRPAWLPFLVLLVCAALAGQIGGSALFRWLSGGPAINLATLGASRTPGLLIFTLVASGAATLFFYSKSKMHSLQAAAAREKASAEAISRQALQAQLQLLQAQIEPHMLFNTLANVQGLIGLDPQRAQVMLDQLVQYLRATLSSSRAESTTLQQEFSLMEAYLGLMSVRMGQRLRYKLTLPETLSQAKIAPMLLQPLVENAIQHGLEPKIDGGQIDIVAHSDGQMLVLTISDNGLGLRQPSQPRQPGRGTHLGISNITARLRALHGDLAALSLSDTPAGGTIARLDLPLQMP